MANSWSFLFDELNMTKSLGEEIYEDMLDMNAKRDTSQDFWEEDGFSLTGNPAPASPDMIVFGSGLPGGCLLYTSPSPRDYAASRMPSSA